MPTADDLELSGEYEEISDPAAEAEEIFQMPGHEWRLTREQEKAVRDIEEAQVRKGAPIRRRPLIY